MPDFSDAAITNLSVHFVGNKIQEESIRLSDRQLQLDEVILETLTRYFTKPFKDQPFYHLFHETDLSLNEVYVYAKSIFDDRLATDNFHLQSIKLARHLYECADHPNIKGGEFYVTYFDQCYVGDKMTSAIGLFKSENKDAYLKVFEENNEFEIRKEEGININKLDKGCIIFNLQEEEGYKVMLIDNTNKQQEAQYWKDHFIQAQPIKDNYYHTQNYMQLCKDFAMDAFPEAGKADKLALANESATFFKETEAFDKTSFHEKVLQEPEIIEAFEDYKQNYVAQKEIDIVDEFDVAPQAVIKMKRVFKSVIKLDKNFHIYVHGNRDLIKKGYDEDSGYHFYQVFFKEES
ncbi:MAG TPA: hypothetical protein DDY13_04220 [Cytophagales bacterium]|jgi:hypothetical protein|nr:hypothetical protein [Cytophagales bacterium]